MQTTIAQPEPAALPPLAQHPAAGFVAGALAGYAAALLLAKAFPVTKKQTSPVGSAAVAVTAATPSVSTASVDITDAALLAATDAPMFTLQGMLTSGKVVKVYDGDTCTILMPVKGELLKFNCRLLGIDAPELKPPLSQEGRAEEVAKAKLARDSLAAMVLNRVVTVRCHGAEKYGRQLVELWTSEATVGTYVKETSVNQELVRRGLARVFMDNRMVAPKRAATGSDAASQPLDLIHPPMIAPKRAAT